MTNSCGLDLDLSIIGVQMTEMVEERSNNQKGNAGYDNSHAIDIRFKKN